MIIKTFEEALAVAANLHRGQTRWDGSPYICHPMRVALAFNDVHHMIVAILHDVIEDTPMELDEMRIMFGNEVTEAVDSVTKREGEVYKNFINRSGAHPVGRLVKIKDIEDNMSDGAGDEEKHARCMRKWWGGLAILHYAL